MAWGRRAWGQLLHVGMGVFWNLMGLVIQHCECPLCHRIVHFKMADFMLSLSPKSSAKCWGRHTNIVLYFYDIWSQNTLKIIFSRCISYWRKLTSKKIGHPCWWFMKWTWCNDSCYFLTSCVADDIHHIPPSMVGWYYLQVTDAKPEVQLNNLPESGVR